MDHIVLPIASSHIGKREHGLFVTMNSAKNPFIKSEIKSRNTITALVHVPPLLITKGIRSIHYDPVKIGPVQKCIEELDLSIAL